MRKTLINVFVFLCGIWIIWTGLAAAHERIGLSQSEIEQFEKAVEEAKDVALDVFGLGDGRDVEDDVWFRYQERGLSLSIPIYEHGTPSHWRDCAVMVIEVLDGGEGPLRQLLASMADLSFAYDMRKTMVFSPKVYDLEWGLLSEIQNYLNQANCIELYIKTPVFDFDTGPIQLEQRFNGVGPSGVTQTFSTFYARVPTSGLDIPLDLGGEKPPAMLLDGRSVFSPFSVKLLDVVVQDRAGDDSELSVSIGGGIDLKLDCPVGAVRLPSNVGFDLVANDSRFTMVDPRHDRGVDESHGFTFCAEENPKFREELMGDIPHVWASIYTVMDVLERYILIDLLLGREGDGEGLPHGSTFVASKLISGAFNSELPNEIYARHKTPNEYQDDLVRGFAVVRSIWAPYGFVKNHNDDGVQRFVSAWQVMVENDWVYVSRNVRDKKASEISSCSMGQIMPREGFHREIRGGFSMSESVYHGVPECLEAAGFTYDEGALQWVKVPQ